MGRRGRKDVKQFNVGDFVFAKVRGFRAWPARILQTEKRKMHQVYFYGTCNIAKVGIRQLFEYDKHKTRLGDLKNRANTSFKSAMDHIQKSVARPDKDKGYFQAKSDLASENLEEEKDTNSSTDSATSSSRGLDGGKKLSKSKLPFIHITGDSD
ncbi:hypothetical protein ACLKA6_008610 [Drosophila palustris]